MRKIALAAVWFLIVQAAAYNAFGAVGKTYNQMVQKHGALAQVPLGRVAGAKEAARYRARGARGYSFNAGRFKVYAIFNSNNVCFREFTLHNRTLPDETLLLGRLAGTAPKVLWRVPRRAIALQYGSGADAVILRTFGQPGDLSAEANSKALEP